MKKWMLAAIVVAAAGIAAWQFSRPSMPKNGPGWKRPQAIPDAALNKKTLKAVGQSYAKDVAPIIQRACFDCHSSKTVFPWYHALPGVSQYLESHVEEGKRRLDLTDGFPFAGKAPIVMRVRSLGRVVARGSMPLWDYKLMHPASRLSEEEKKVVTGWAESSFEALSRTAKPYAPPAPNS